MADSREVYVRARRRALTRTDPQHTSSNPVDPRAAAATLNSPCACGHANCLHTLGTRKGQPIPTWCTVMTGDGPCSCRLFTPASNPVETEGEPDGLPGTIHR